MTSLREWLEMLGQFTSASPPSELTRMFQLVERVQDAARKNSGGWLAERDLYLKDLKLAEDKTMRLCRNIVVESVELLDSFNWKEHKVWRADVVNRDNIRVEIVDLLHYVFEIALNWGITPAMIVADFEKKAAENIARQESGY